MSKLKDELAEMQRQRNAAIAIWQDLEKELQSIGKTTSNGVPNMTLRDYFAGQALCGIMAEGNPKDANLWVGPVAYEIADEMIEARDEDPDE